jgi:hypothetical protein
MHFYAKCFMHFLCHLVLWLMKSLASHDRKKKKLVPQSRGGGGSGGPLHSIPTAWDAHEAAERVLLELYKKTCA